jgi:hypothetical protein
MSVKLDYYSNATVMNVRPAHSIFLLTIALETSAAWALAFADLHNSDPSEWTGPEVYQILNNSAWTKTLKMNFSNGSSDGLGNQNAGSGSNTTGQMPAGAGGMGRRGMGGGRSRGTYSSGSSGNSSTPKSGPTEVIIQWQSAVVVRMAAAKKAGETVDAASFKPLDEYVVAVIGLPITAVGGRAASADSDNTLSGEEEQRIEDHVKSSASILRPGHEPLTPTKVELDQGSDGRMLIHFPKSDPIMASDKSVEFRLAVSRGELRKKFPLKDMEYEGKLEL